MRRQVRAYSPDMSHIEHVQTLVVSRLDRDPRPTAPKSNFRCAYKQNGITFLKLTFNMPHCIAAFIVVCVLVGVGLAAARGDPKRLWYGYDSYGNICGIKNDPIPSANNSGKDFRGFK
ncbi:hypothetical protein TNCV_2107851 [Trichonephila clavipes]|nr:hypothetical protein TNCV_2107851 [Trichonephila clavipes]